MKLIIFRVTTKYHMLLFFPWPWHDPSLSHVIFFSDLPRSFRLLSLPTRVILEFLYSRPLLNTLETTIQNLAEVTRLVGAKLAREIPCNRCGTAEYWCCEMPLSMQALAANASGTLLSPFT